MIVFDASVLVGAALKMDSVPALAFFKAERIDVFALSEAVEAEIAEVLSRPKFARTISPGQRNRILTTLRRKAARFEPEFPVTDCRDPDDDKYLALALASGAHSIVSSDNDLLALHPWRGVRILRPAEYLLLP